MTVTQNQNYFSYEILLTEIYPKKSIEYFQSRKESNINRDDTIHTSLTRRETSAKQKVTVLLQGENA